MKRDHIIGERPQQRSYSRAVVTRGGKTIWLAGQTAMHDEEGRSLAGDFEAQAHGVFRALARTLGEAGATLTDIVTMTVFLKDSRHGDTFVAIRRSYFPDNFPASALIAVSGFARPEALIEIQAVAIVDGG